MLQLTCMGVEDLSEVMVLERAGHDFPWSEGVMASCLSRHHHARLLYEDQVLVGFAILQQVLDEASLLNMVIAAAARRRGHGRWLLARLIAEVHDQVKVIHLEVRPSNLAAVALYESMGFNEYARRPRYYPRRGGGYEDAIPMALSLEPDTMRI